MHWLVLVEGIPGIEAKLHHSHTTHVSQTSSRTEQLAGDLLPEEEIAGAN